MSFQIFVSSFYRKLSNLNITNLNLSGVVIKEQKANTIIAAFDRSLQHMQCLIMSNCNLYTRTLVIIISKLHIARNMKELQICHNHIDDGATKYIIIAMFQWRSFKTLKFEKNNFTESAQKFLTFTLGLLNPSVPSANHLILDSDSVKLLLTQLSDNNCVIECAPLLFQRLDGLTALDLCCIQLRPEDKDVISDALTVNMTSLQSLNLDGWNIHIVKILKALNKGTLKELSLSNNNITSHTAHIIKDFLSDNHILTKICLSHNKLGNDGIATIAEGLVSCRKVQILDLSYNNITDEATDPLRSLMKQLYQYGNLSFLNVHDDGLRQQSLGDIYYAAGWLIWLKYKTSQLSYIASSSRYRTTNIALFVLFICVALEVLVTYYFY